MPKARQAAARDAPEQTPATAADEPEPAPDDQPSHLQSKIQKRYTPRHHDPEEDQLRTARAVTAEVR